MATKTSASSANLAPSFSVKEKESHLGDTSFSSYLGEGSFILKYEDSTLNLPSASIVATEPLYQVGLGSRKHNQGDEISIFDSEKYFKKEVDNGKSPNRDEKIELLGFKSKMRIGTPGICSEVSWNNQSALLPGYRRDPDLNLHRQNIRQRFLSSFGCNCSGKNSVVIDEKAEEKNPSNGRKIYDLGSDAEIITKETLKTGHISVGTSRFREDMNYPRFDNGGVEYKKEDVFTFPVLKPLAGNSTVGGQSQVEEQQEEEKPRVSLEVFGSPPLGKKELDPSQHRRLIMSALNPFRQVNDSCVSSGGTFKMDDGDLGSDSSSDLFEIGSLSDPQSVLSRQGSTSCYEPNETSIKWRVATAKTKTTANSKNKNGGISMVREAQKRQPGSFLSCKSRKAVNVATETIKMPEKLKQNARRRLQSDSITPSTIYQGRPLVTGSDSLRISALSQSHSGIASDSIPMH